jgi:hypothetical protein
MSRRSHDTPALCSVRLLRAVAHGERLRPFTLRIRGVLLPAANRKYIADHLKKTERRALRNARPLQFTRDGAC